MKALDFIRNLIANCPDQYLPIYVGIGIVCLVILGLMLTWIADIFRNLRKMRDIEDEAYLNRKELMEKVKESDK